MMTNQTTQLRDPSAQAVFLTAGAPEDSSELPPAGSIQKTRAFEAVYTPHQSALLLASIHRSPESVQRRTSATKTAAAHLLP